MSDANTEPMIQVPEAVQRSIGPQDGAVSPGASPAPAGAAAPGTAPAASRGPSRARTGGIPAGPVALASANAATLGGSIAMSSFGLPGLAASLAVSAGLAMAALTSAPGRSRNASRRRRLTAASGRPRSSVNPRSRRTNNVGGGGGPRSGRSGRVNGRSGSGGTPGRGRHRSGSSSNPRSGRVGSTGSRTRMGGSGSSRPGGVRSTRRGRTPWLFSQSGRSSRTRQAIGPRPSRSRRGGLIRRGNGSRRQPICAVRNGARRTINGARAVRHAARVTGRGVRRGWNSRPGRATRRCTIASARRSWGVGWPATRSALSFLGGLVGRRSVRQAWAAGGRTWRRLRARWAPRSRHAHRASEPTEGLPDWPGDTINRPTSTVGPAGARASAPTGGVTMSRSAFNTAAAEMLGAAMVYEPEGMMEYGNDLSQLGEAFRNIAQAVQTMVARTDGELPLHPSIVDMLRTMHTNLQATATQADELGPAFRSLHDVDIRRISEPRPGEREWDLSRNSGHVGSTTT